MKWEIWVSIRVSVPELRKSNAGALGIHHEFIGISRYLIVNIWYQNIPINNGNIFRLIKLIIRIVRQLDLNNWSGCLFKKHGWILIYLKNKWGENKMQYFKISIDMVVVVLIGLTNLLHGVSF